MSEWLLGVDSIGGEKMQHGKLIRGVALAVPLALGVVVANSTEAASGWYVPGSISAPVSEVSAVYTTLDISRDRSAFLHQVKNDIPPKNAKLKKLADRLYKKLFRQVDKCVWRGENGKDTSGLYTKIENTYDKYVATLAKLGLSPTEEFVIPAPCEGVS